MPNTIIHTPVDTEIDIKARTVLQHFGLSMNEAITLFLRQVAENKKIPFSVDIPNKETQIAIEDACNGNVECYSSLDSMWPTLLNYVEN